MAVFGIDLASTGDNYWKPWAYAYGQDIHNSEVASGHYPFDYDVLTGFSVPTLVKQSPVLYFWVEPLQTLSTNQVTADTIECFMPTTWWALVAEGTNLSTGYWIGNGHVLYPATLATRPYPGASSGAIYEGTVSGQSYLGNMVYITVDTWHNSITAPYETYTRRQWLSRREIVGEDRSTIQAANVLDCLFHRVTLNARLTDMTGSALASRYPGNEANIGTATIYDEGFIKDSYARFNNSPCTLQSIRSTNSDFKTEQLETYGNVVLNNFVGTLGDITADVTFSNYHTNAYHKIINKAPGFSLAIVNDNEYYHDSGGNYVYWWISNTPAQAVRIVLINCTFAPGNIMYFSAVPPSPPAGEVDCSIELRIEDVHFDPDDTGQAWGLWQGVEGNHSLDLSGFFGTKLSPKAFSQYGIPTNKLNNTKCNSVLVSENAPKDSEPLHDSLQDAPDYSKLFGESVGGAPINTAAKALSYTNLVNPDLPGDGIPRYNRWP